jgi:hypothetical protein
MQDKQIWLVRQRDAARQLEVASVHRGTDLHASHVDLDARRDPGRLGLDGDLDELLVEQAVRRDLTDDRDRDVDGDLLAAPHQDEVDMLDGALDRVTLDRLGQGELAAVRQAVEPDQDVGGAKGEQNLVARQADVPRRGAVAVEDRRNPAGPALPPRGTLTEFGPRRCGDMNFGHGATPQRVTALARAEFAASLADDRPASSGRRTGSSPSLPRRPR